LFRIMPARIRIDRLLVERGLFESRAKAQAAIAAGLVTADDVPVAKPSAEISAEAVIRAEPAFPWVSRAGVKLAHTLDRLGFDVTGRVGLDVGASTGGFTEVLLARGARRVYTVDVGRGQLHARLRDRPEVVSLEGTDIRELASGAVGWAKARAPHSDGGQSLTRAVPTMKEPGQRLCPPYEPHVLEPPPDIVTIDVSFISLKHVLPAALALAAPRAQLVALIKPQFEAGKRHINKKGIVREAAVHDAVCADIAACVRALGCEVVALVPSPIAGSDGNREFFIGARRG
jgi:23S rRNA (cytidine1920-2'-O)/16S rRNA (cytidine1409-2'-O)-methyltransferase